MPYTSSKAWMANAVSQICEPLVPCGERITLQLPPLPHSTPNFLDPTGAQRLKERVQGPSKQDSEEVGAQLIPDPRLWALHSGHPQEPEQVVQQTDMGQVAQPAFVRISARAGLLRHFQGFGCYGLHCPPHPAAWSPDRLVALSGPRHHGLARQCVERKDTTKTAPGHKNLI